MNAKHCMSNTGHIVSILCLHRMRCDQTKDQGICHASSVDHITYYVFYFLLSRCGAHGRCRHGVILRESSLKNLIFEIQCCMLIKYQALPNQACCSPSTSIARPKSANFTAAPLDLEAKRRFSGQKHKNKHVYSKKKFDYSLDRMN